MSIAKRVFYNTTYQVLGKIFTSVSTLLLTILITRVLGAETFGEYSIVIAFATPFYLISDLGINAIIAREFSKTPSIIKRNFSSILVLKVFIGFFLMFFSNIILEFFPYTTSVKYAIRLASFLVLFHAIFSTCNIIFQAKLKYKYLAVSSFVGSLLSLIFVYIAIVNNASLPLIVLALVLGNLFYPIVSLLFVKENISFAYNPVDLTYWRQTLKISFPLGSALILNVLMVNADRILLSIMSNPISVGIYSLAYKVFEVILVLPTFFMNALFPVLVKYNDKSPSELGRVLGAALTAMFSLGLLVTIAGVFSSRFLIPLIWGKEMALAFIPFNILIIGSITFFLSSPLSWVLVVQNKQKFLPFLYGFAFLLNVLLNIIFIPHFDYIASAVITVVTELVVLIALYYLVLVKGSIKLKLK